MAWIRFMPEDKSAKVKPGTTLFQAGRAARVFIRSRCGGNAACLMCKVKVEDQSGLAPPNRNEIVKLGSLTKQGVRLSCQARITGDVTVEVPEDPLKSAIRALLAKQQEEDDGI
jgi:2Fe-2S ferredoxin